MNSALFGWSRVLAGMALFAGAIRLNAADPVSGPQAIHPLAAPKSDAEMQAMRAAARQKEKEWEDNVALELVGIGRMAGTPVGLMAVDGNLCAIMSGISLAGRLVDELDPEHGRVTLRRRDQSPTVLTLTTTNPIKLPEMNERQVEFLLSKEGIKHMQAFRGMPMELRMVWDKVSREGQTEVLISYLRQGMVVGFPNRHVSYTGKLLEKRIAERFAEKRNALVASLTPEQKAVYMTPQPAIRFTAPAAEREKHMAAAQAAQRRRDEMLEKLTPEQRALYDEYQSWIRPDGRP